jgi:hypothetical protein
MGRICSTQNGKVRERETTWKTDVGVRIIIKWILDRRGLYGLDCSGSEQRREEGSCEHSNEPSESIKCCEIPE